MKYCIVNADDFGLSPGVCRGILTAMEKGIVTATSAMVCAPNAAQVIPRYLQPLHGRLGLHLQLTKGACCSDPGQIPSLVEASGRFPDSLDPAAQLDPDEVLQEFRAQVARLREFGAQPSHLDSHHHVHKLPGVFPAYCRLARELGVPARGLGTAHTAALRRQGIPAADVFVGSWFKDAITPGELLELAARALPALPEQGCMEIMTHPGYADTPLEEVSSYTAHRETELQSLCAAELRQGLRELGLTLAGPEILLPGRMPASSAT